MARINVLLTNFSPVPTTRRARYETKHISQIVTHDLIFGVIWWHNLLVIFKAGMGLNPTAGSIYSLIPKIAIAFSMLFSAEVITAFAPD
jgi:hypothetical protein